jgi:hypothetical protein
MKNLIAAIALLCSLIPVSQASDNPGDPARATKSEPAQAPETIGDGVRQVGREIKSAGRTVRRAVVTRCADGRHTVRGKAACAGHGGVSAQN